MCGIVGGTNPQWPFQQATTVLRHRGPDSQQIEQIGPMTLGFARLAIIDLRAVANQPMAAADGQVWIVFNGEIYGFDRVRRLLESRGRHFVTRSDTEVVLQSYLEWGDALVDHLDGMFAIAIYDRREEKLKLFRDRPGIKPLYYYFRNGEFAFASELKAIETLIGSRHLETNNSAVYDFLTYRYVPTPKTLFKSVFKLPPATRLVYDLRRRKIEGLERYWHLPVNGGNQRIRLDEACGQLREMIDTSVAEQLVADVPVGCFLSGGMDSSVVVAAGSRHRQSLETISIGFDDDARSETRFARRVARQFATDHREATLSKSALHQLFPSLKAWYDEPFGDTSAFPTFYVSRCAKETVTVALSGDGGDELFGGYGWYHAVKRLRRLGVGRFGNWGRFFQPGRPTAGRRTLLGKALAGCALAGSDLWSLYTRYLGGMLPAERARYRKLLGIGREYDDYWHYRRYWRKDLPLATRMQYLDFHTFLPDDILTKVDRVSMANSLEVRVPLLSRRLIEFAFGLPEPVRYAGSELKGVLKQAYISVLPRSILDREKQGFSEPSGYKTHGERPRGERILAELFGIEP